MSAHIALKKPALATWVQRRRERRAAVRNLRAYSLNSAVRNIMAEVRQRSVNAEASRHLARLEAEKAAEELREHSSTSSQPHGGRCD